MGMTQLHFAHVLGISRANIAMVEVGQRELPNPAFLKLLQLQRLSEGAPVQEDFPNELENKKDEIESLIASTKFLVSKRQKLLDHAKRKLEKMKTDYMGASVAIRLMNDELTLFEGIEAYTSKMQSRIAHAEKVKSRSHPIHQRVLQLRVNELESLVVLSQTELTELEQLIA